MTVRRRLKDNSIKVGLMVILFFLSLKSCVAKGKTIMFPTSYLYAANRHQRGVNAVEKTNIPSLLRYELALSRRQRFGK